MIEELAKSNIARAKQYLESRHLDSEFVSLTNLGFLSTDIISKMNLSDARANALVSNDGKPYYQSHIVFPTYNTVGQFSGFIGRATFDTEFKYKLPQHILFSKETYIHGFMPDDMDRDYCFVSENMVEFGRVLQCGFQSVSLNGAFKSKYKMQVLANIFKHLIFIVDNDFAGNELKSFIKTFLTDYKVKVSFVEHTEKGFDEFYVKNGKDKSQKFLHSYV